MVSIMVDKKLLDMANKVAGEFNSEKDFEEFKLGRASCRERV